MQNQIAWKVSKNTANFLCRHWRQIFIIQNCNFNLFLQISQEKGKQFLQEQEKTFKQGWHTTENSQYYHKDILNTQNKTATQNFWKGIYLFKKKSNNKHGNNLASLKILFPSSAIENFYLWSSFEKHENLVKNFR